MFYRCFNPDSEFHHYNFHSIINYNAKSHRKKKTCTRIDMSLLCSSYLSYRRFADGLVN